MVSFIGTVFYGCILLSQQVSLKGFLAASSVVNLSFWLVVLPLIKNSIGSSIPTNQCILYLFAYIDIYIISSSVIFILWSSFQNFASKAKECSINNVLDLNYLQSIYFSIKKLKDNWVIVGL